MTNTFITRMHNELTDLGNKIAKEEEFIKTEVFKGLSFARRSLLQTQVIHMKNYHEALEDRIKLYQPIVTPTPPAMPITNDAEEWKDVPKVATDSNNPK